MPISVEETRAVAARLNRESDPRGALAEFDREEAARRLRGDDPDGDDQQGDEESDVDEEERVRIEGELLTAAKAQARAANEARREANARKKEEARERQEHSVSISFAKRLAHNDKKVRDTSVKSLRRWLLKREHLNEDDLLKIWKGLFYCFWMSDKTAVQQQLADALSDLLLPPLEFSRALLLFSGCLTTLRREWTAIDQLRMDKFMSLARRFLQKALAAAAAGGWAKAQVEALTDVLLQSGAVSPDTEARGFAFHLIDCFLPEVERVAAAASTPAQVLSFEALNTLLTPFYHVLARSHDRTLVARVRKEVFDTLREVCATPLNLDQTPPAKEKTEKKKSKATKKGKKEEDEDEEMEEAEEAEAEAEKAGEVEGLAAEFPALHAVLHGNADQIAAILFTLGADPEVIPRNRKQLYAYRAEFTQIHAQEDEAGAEEEEEAPAASVQAATVLPKKSRKRKATSEVDPALAGVGSEVLGVAVKERAKKKNKKQRLADKRKKKELLLGSEPGREAQQDEQEDEPEAEDEDAEMAEAEAELEDSELEAVEDSEAAAVLAQPISKKEQKRLEQVRADKQKQQSPPKKRVQPQPVVEEELEAAEEDDAEEAEDEVEVEEEDEVEDEPESEPAEPEPEPQPKKKQRVSTGAAQPALQSPLQPTTPPKAGKPSLAFSTPQVKVTAAAPVIGGTTVRPTAPPSSSKKSVRIMLQNNQVKSFKKFSRDSVTTQTQALLAKPSPGSAIKPTSMEFFLQHNKNGRELAARQKALASELAAASTDSPKRLSKATPPVSPRAKAADYFFKDSD